MEHKALSRHCLNAKTYYKNYSRNHHIINHHFYSILQTLSRRGQLGNRDDQTAKQLSRSRQTIAVTKATQTKAIQIAPNSFFPQNNHRAEITVTKKLKINLTLQLLKICRSIADILGQLHPITMTTTQAMKSFENNRLKCILSNTDAFPFTSRKSFKRECSTIE